MERAWNVSIRNGCDTFIRKLAIHSNLPWRYFHFFVEPRATHCTCQKCTKVVETSSRYSQFEIVFAFLRRDGLSRTRHSTWLTENGFAHHRCDQRLTKPDKYNWVAIRPGPMQSLPTVRSRFRTSCPPLSKRFWRGEPRKWTELASDEINVLDDLKQKLVSPCSLRYQDETAEWSWKLTCVITKSDVYCY